ncbi:MAG: NosR/NirI family nitrous oxide reductase transcriptional regulator, partial [Halieaceae bacterium]
MTPKYPALVTALLSVLLLCAALSSNLSFAANSGLEDIGLAEISILFPDATTVGQVEGKLPTREVIGNENSLGYVFMSDEISAMPGYSGKSIRLLIGLSGDAHIAGAIVIEHEEPILVIGITETDLDGFIDQYRGLMARERVRVGAHNRVGYVGVDGISGATITAMVINTSIMKSAQLVAESMGLPKPRAEATPIQTITLEPAIASITERPEWMDLWQEQAPQLSLLLFALLVLMGILFFQDLLVKHITAFHRVRIAYLLFTVVYLGIVCKAQLSVINLLAFMRVLFGNFTWDTLLLDPVIFLLWGFVATSILLWGRGVFCGWLCPFGALQELIHKVAERLKWPSYEFPPIVHERLWAIKYFILIALVGLSLESMTLAAKLAEVEPFKTTFVMQFNRESWFVVYALLLLGISAFNSKFYCKYLCPLGAGLSFFTKFRIFNWLRRRKECGKPCQSCAAQCQISAIKPTGEIIDNECHYCLEC